MARPVIMRISLALALALASLLFAQRAAAQPSSSCTSAIVGLAPCLGYITGNSSSPSSACCTQLASVVQTQVQCLCTLLNNGAAQFGLSINQTLALTLPGKCKVRTPPLSQCNAVSPAQSPAGTPITPFVPSTAPTASPSTPTTPGSSSTPTNPSMPSVPTTPSGSGKGSNTVPTSPTAQSSGSSSYKSAGTVIFAALFVIVSASSLAV